MKKMKKSKIALIISLSIASAVGIVACSSQLIGSNGGMQVMGIQDQIMPEFKAGEFFKFMTELNLTGEQKEKMQVLRGEGMQNFKTHEGDREKIHESMKTAFLSATVDKETLKKQLETLKPNVDLHIKNMATHIIQVNNILTPDQRDKVEAFIDKMASEHAVAAIKDKRMEMFTQGLDISDAQKAKINELFQNNKDFRDEIFNTVKGIKSEIFTALKTGTATEADLVKILSEAKPALDKFMDKQLDNIISIHDILTPEQREQAAKKFEEKHNHIKNFFMHHKPFMN